MKVTHLRHIGAALLLSLGSLAGSLTARAGAPDHLQSLTVSVWLDYDHPGALYMYAGQLATGTRLPAQISFCLPVSSGGASSTAGVDASGNYRYIRPTVSEEGDILVVAYDINWPAFQLEYYDNSVQRQGESQQFELVYRADYAIDQLALEIKEPYAAASFALDLPESSQGRDGDGQIVHRRIIGPLQQGQEVRWKATYTRSDTRLVSEALGLPDHPTSPYEAGPGIAMARPLDQRLLIAIVVVAVVVTAGGLAFWLLFRGRRPAARAAYAAPAPAASRKQRKRQGKADPSGQPHTAGAVRYCHKCGAALREGDRFCPRCGTPRR